ncbi:MAG: hypothetical protein ACKVOK_04740, partial [Flavobacteriales bacterium]
MKKLNLFIVLVLPAICNAQSTPASGDPVISEHYETLQNRDFGDTITFNELTSGTVVSDQYASTHGAIFSGWPQAYFCDT